MYHLMHNASLSTEKTQHFKQPSSKKDHTFWTTMNPKNGSIEEDNVSSGRMKFFSWQSLKSSTPSVVHCAIQRMVSDAIRQESKKIICIAMNHSKDCLPQHVKLIKIIFTCCMHMALTRDASQIQTWSNTYQCNQRSLLFISGYMGHQRQIFYKSTCLSLWSITGTQHSPLQHKTTLRKGMNDTYYLLAQIESSDLLM